MSQPDPTDQEKRADLQRWLASRPHVAWCRCKSCRFRLEMAEAAKLGAMLESGEAKAP